jgi:plasmid stability protein
MTNLTISLDEVVVRNARIRAIGQGTSLSAKVREFLASYASGAAERTSGDATTDLMRMMDDVRNEIAQNKTSTATAPKGQTLREEMYEGDYRARDRIEGAWPNANGTPRL